MTVVTDDEIRSVVLREVDSFVPKKAIAPTDDLQHDLRLLSDDGAQLITALERRLGVNLPQSRLNTVHNVNDLAELFVEFRQRKGNAALAEELREAKTPWLEGEPIRPRPALWSPRQILGVVAMVLGVICFCGAIFLFVEVGPEQKGFWIAVFLALAAFVGSASLMARR